MKFSYCWLKYFFTNHAIHVFVIQVKKPFFFLIIIGSDGYWNFLVILIGPSTLPLQFFLWNFFAGSEFQLFFLEWKDNRKSLQERMALRESRPRENIKGVPYRSDTPFGTAYHLRDTNVKRCIVVRVRPTTLPNDEVASSSDLMTNKLWYWNNKLRSWNRKYFFLIAFRIMSKIYWVLPNVIISHTANFKKIGPLVFELFC